MISYKQAQNYSEQLHPAFAGYLHDGTISERDALATLFHFLDKGYVIPTWQDNDMTKRITGLKRTRKQPKFNFEKLILSNLFFSKNNISSREVGILIRRRVLQRILEKNIKSINQFPLVNKTLKYTYGNSGKEMDAYMTVLGKREKVDTLEEAKTFRMLFTWIMFPIAILTIVIIVVVIIPLSIENAKSVST